jgi:hypothetical protein
MTDTSPTNHENREITPSPKRLCHNEMEGLNGRNKQSSSKALECGHLRLGVMVLVSRKAILSWP